MIMCLSKYYNDIAAEKKVDNKLKTVSKKRPLYVFVDIKCQLESKIYFILLVELLPTLVKNLLIGSIGFKAKKGSFSLYFVIYSKVLYPKNSLRQFISSLIRGYLDIEIELKDVKIYRSKKSLKSCFVLY